MTTNSKENHAGRPSAQEQFAKMYQSVIKDKRLNDKDFRILALIKSYSGTWRVRQAQIARELDVSISTVIRSINRLDAAGYLTYETKQTKTGSERRNVQMVHRPNHWNEVEPAKSPSNVKKAPTSKVTGTPTKNDSQPLSKMKRDPVKNDTQTMSDLTSYEESIQSYYGESVTKSYDAEVGSETEGDAQLSLWAKYNAVPEGYITIDPYVLCQDDRDLVPRMVEDLQVFRAGLQLKAGERDIYGLDAGYYKEAVVEQLNSRKAGRLLPRLFVHAVNEGDYDVYARSDIFR